MALSLFVLLTLPGSLRAAASRPATLRVQTLVRVSSSIRGFGQDGLRIAWLTGTDGRRCTRTLHVRSLYTRRTQTALQPSCKSNPAYISRLALAGRRASWDSYVDSAEHRFDVAIVTAGVPEHRAHRVASIRGTRGEGNPEFFPNLTGAGTFLAYSTQTGVRRIVNGRARRFFDFSKPLGLAVGSGMVAVVRQEPRLGDGCACVSSPDWRADNKIGFLSMLSLPPAGKKEITLIDPSGTGRTVLTDDDRRREGLDWSRNGTTLAYSYITGAGGTLIAVASPDGSGAHDVASGKYPALSPDGTKIAYTLFEGAEFLYVQDVNGGPARLLSVGTAPSWSPDGTQIAFTSLAVRLDVINADGSGEYPVGPSGSYDPEWSPDGQRLAFARYGAAAGIWEVSADGSGLRRLTEGPDEHPRWSPDGRALVFASRRNDLGDKPYQTAELYVVNADGTGLRPLTFSVPARWVTSGEVRSTTGRHLASFEADGADGGVALAGTKVALVTQDRAGAGTLTLFSSTTGARLASAPLPGPLPSIAGANRRWVVFRTGARTIRAFDLRDSTTRTLAVARVAPIGLSVSGRRVAWAENQGNHARIRAVTLPG